MTTATMDRDADRAEGERRKAAAHALLAARRGRLIRRARRALLSHLVTAGTGTADDVADAAGPTDPGIDPRWRGDVPGALARAGIIRDTGRTVRSCRPEAHARRLPVWELADPAAAVAWLAAHPELSEPDSAATADPTSIEPAAAPQQLTLWE